MSENSEKCLQLVLSKQQAKTKLLIVLCEKETAKNEFSGLEVSD